MKRFDDALVSESPVVRYQWPRTLEAADIPDPAPCILTTINTALLVPVELPDGSHECVAPRDPFAWLDALGAPATVVVEPVVRTPRRWLALAFCIVPVLALAGEFVGRWVQ